MRWMLAARTRRKGSRLARRFRVAGLTGMAALLVPLAAVTPPAAAAGPAHLLPAPATKPVPVHVVPSHPVKVPQGKAWHMPRTTWPAAGTDTVTVAGPAAARGSADAIAGSGTATAGVKANVSAAARTAAMAAPSAGSSRAGSLPVWVGPAMAKGSESQAATARSAAPGSGAGDVRVTMASRQTAAKAGISGVVFTVAQAGAGTEGRAVHVSLDYSSFAYADGGDFASRLHLVELPACALTTPAVPSCRRQTPLASSDDVQHTSLGVNVTLPGAAPPAGGSPGTAAASPAVLLGATTSPSGSGGDYTATPLSEEGEWSAGGSSGAFTYSYPISVPPVPGGLEPSVSLDYDSQAVDGLTSSTNDQASWIGDGWDYEPGYIERDYQSCEQNPAGSTQTGDECWSSDDVTTLSLGGVTTTLVDDPVNGWHAEADNGYQVTYTTGTGANGTYDDDYWVVTAPDGTSYWFGRNELPGYASGDATTGSVFTVPVYATASGQPCYNATFSKSVCNQAWRWNLDWVTDPHGDAMAYYYQSETNYYAQDNGTTAPLASAYTQGGVLKQVQYGLRSASGYGTPAAEVNFTSPATRTDVPTGSSQDLACSSGATCGVASPTFWDKYQLTTITTSTLEGGAQAAVDSWALKQEYLSTGATSPAPLWLDSITHTGEDGSATPVGPVTFGSTGEGMDNRVATAANLQDGYSMIPRNRIGSVTTETGGVIKVTYDTPPSSCTSGSFPADDANTLLCYPAYWTPPGGTAREDWFNKYVVSSVSQQDTTGGVVPVLTSYSYSGAAWHYDDDALSRSGQRTWDEWRGFQTVTTETGNAAYGDPVTETADTYFQGMNGDYQGTGNPATSASLTAKVGGTTIATVTDSDQLDGDQFQQTTYDGAGGAVVSSTVTTPWTSAATATQSQPSPLPALNAYMTGTAKTQAFTALASGGYREADTTYTHDSLGRVTSAESVPDASDNGVAGDATEDTCTQTSYPPSGTILTLPQEVIVTSVPPASCPVSGTPAQSELISDTRTYYDGASSDTTPPTTGNATEILNATSYSGATPVFTPQSQDTYDQYGRVLTSLDADAIAAIAAGKTGNIASPTTITYTPATGAEPTSIKVTDPMDLGAGTTTTYDPARDLPLTVTTPSGLVTTKTYDGLGRITAVWTPGHSGELADETYTYSPPGTEPSVVTTNTIDAAGNYLPSETLYDSLGRQIETQAQTVDGKRNITDTYYNSDGWVTVQSNPYTANPASQTSVLSGQLVAAADGAVPNQTAYVYDGDGRVTRQITDSLATELWETDTSYGGDYTTVTPPAGGTATTTYVNGIGKTSYLYQYHAAAPPATPPAPGTASSPGSSGWDETAYTYTPSGQQATITDPAGKDTWTYGYNLLGQQTSAADPDAGDTTSTYDPDGNLTSVTRLGAGSGGSTTTSYTYDPDGRKTAEYDTTGGAAEAGSDEVAAWTYDTLAAGQPYQSISYTGGTSGTSYTESVTGYNSLGLPQGEQLKISGTGPWAGSYKETYGYTPYGNQLSTISYPAVGGLPSEAVSIGYDAADEPADMAGIWDYVAAMTYTELGQPQEYALGTTDDPVEIYDNWDLYTGRLDSSEVQAGSSPVTLDNMSYTYDNAGLIQDEADTPSGGPSQVQCFTYDYLGRLTAAWSQGTLPSSGCATTGPNGGTTTQASEASAAAPYWEQYSYDLSGDLGSITSTSAAGTTTTTQQDFPSPGSTAYQPSGSAAQPPNAVTGTGPAGFTTPTTSYAYDQAGDLTSITAPGTSQALSWSDQGQLSAVTTTGGTSAGTTSYTYDADGNLLQQADSAAGTATLYLPGEQLTKTTSGTTTYNSTRYYAIGGVTIAARTSAGNVEYLAGNQQGTATLAIDSTSLTPTNRYYDPYGNTIGTPAATWPGTQGFVGGTTDTSTSLENLGAREYNPATGSFISPDPILNPGDPQDLNAYAYSADDPASMSDPSGAIPVCDGGCDPQPSPPPCAYIGDCHTALPPPGVAAPGAPNSSDPNGIPSADADNGNDGNMYVPITPHVIVQTSDPYYTTMSTAYQNYLSAHPNFKPANLNVEIAAWDEICYQNPHACPQGFRYDIGPWGTLGKAMSSGGLAGGDAIILIGDLSVSSAPLPGESPESPFKASDVNAFGGTRNCVACSIAGDATSRGYPAVARNILGGEDGDEGRMDTYDMEMLYDSHFEGVSGPGGIETILRGLGDGAKGIVYAEWRDENGDYAGSHVFNAQNENGNITYTDYQNFGEEASFEGYSGYAFMVTGVP
ncbi:MAG TPA: RHS repeat-associated core domain-containing protein [Trebonia sp.]|nr:RHS repeat-associated core domain-containing protein [Trebonia sp.]